MDSSKRSLYKPAPVENYVEREARRTLVQGRLTNDTVLPESLTLYASPSLHTSGQDTVTRISHDASGLNESSMSPARQSMASLSLSHQAPSLSSDISTSLPRSSPLHHYMADRSYSPPRSPSKPSPSDFLELSDSDREHVNHHMPPVRHFHAMPGSPVLLIDASGHRFGQGQAEVEVKTANIISPAKVVCHTLSSLDNDLRNAGYTEEAARVHIDSVPSVTVLADADLREGVSAERSQHQQNGLPGQTHESPAISRESSMASEKHGDGESTASTLKPNEMLSHQESQDALPDLTSESERPSTAMSIDEHRGSESTKKKKKKKVKGKFVQSRYMQSVSKPAASAPNISVTGARPNLSGTRSNVSGIGARSNINGTRSNTSGAGPKSASTSSAQVRSARPGTVSGSRVKTSSNRPNNISVKRTERSKSASERPAPMKATKSFAPTSSTTHAPAVDPSRRKQHPSTGGDSQFNTPVTAKKGKRFASTPHVNTSLLPGASHINASAIGASTSILGANMSAIAHVDSSKLMPDKMRDSHDIRDGSRQEKGMSGNMTGQYSGLSASPTQDSAYSSLGQKQVKQLTQSDLDVMYARYLQAVFLDTKMKKVVADKEKEAMSQLYSMWQLNDELSKKKSQLELKLARLRHANTLDHHLDVQETGLGPVTAHLSQFKQEYSTLAHALDTTRHQVEMTDILLPHDKDAFHDTLEKALNESEHLLGEISMATRSKQPKVEAFSTAISMLENAVANESEELRRCQELLAATSSLATHETSLRVQDLEQRSAE